MRTKSVIVISADLSTGLAANAAAVLAATLGHRIPGLLGPDVIDADGATHPGVVAAPLPILRHSPEGLRDLSGRAAADEAVFVASFSALAQHCRTYEDYTARLRSTSTGELDLVGIALHGPRKNVDRLAGALPLLR